MEQAWDGGEEGGAGEPGVPDGAGELDGGPLGVAVAQDAVDARDRGCRDVGAHACKNDGNDIREYVSMMNDILGLITVEQDWVKLRQICRPIPNRLT